MGLGLSLSGNLRNHNYMEQTTPENLCDQKVKGGQTFGGPGTCGGNRMTGVCLLERHIERTRQKLQELVTIRCMLPTSLSPEQDQALSPRRHFLLIALLCLGAIRRMDKPPQYDTGSDDEPLGVKLVRQQEDRDFYREERRKAMEKLARCFVAMLALGLFSCQSWQPVVSDQQPIPVTLSEDIYGHYYTTDDGVTIFPGEPPR